MQGCSSCASVIGLMLSLLTVSSGVCSRTANPALQTNLGLQLHMLPVCTNSGPSPHSVPVRLLCLTHSLRLANPVCLPSPAESHLATVVQRAFLTARHVLLRFSLCRCCRSPKLYPERSRSSGATKAATYLA